MFLSRAVQSGSDKRHRVTRPRRSIAVKCLIFQEHPQAPRHIQRVTSCGSSA